MALFRQRRASQRAVSPAPAGPTQLLDQLDVVLRAGLLRYEAALALSAALDAEGPDLLDELWDQHVEAQRSWPTVTDSDRLQSAFAQLAQAGLITWFGEGCCRHCPPREIAAKASPEHRGYVFFPEPAGVEALGTTLELSFGTLGRRPGAWDQTGFDHATLELGEEIIVAVSRAGLAAGWDRSSPQPRLVITHLDWKRRLLPRPN